MRAAARELDDSEASVIAHDHMPARAIELAKGLVTFARNHGSPARRLRMLVASQRGVAMLAWFIVASACGNGAQLAHFELVRFLSFSMPRCNKRKRLSAAASRGARNPAACQLPQRYSGRSHSASKSITGGESAKAPSASFLSC